MGNSLSTFSGCLNHVAEAYPYQRAISVRGGGDLLYADLHDSVEKAAFDLLSGGVKHGDLVPIVFSDDVKSVVLLLAAMRVRAVAVPSLQPVCTDEDFERYLGRYIANFSVGSSESNPTVHHPIRDLPGAAADVPAGNISSVTNDPADTAILLLPTAADGVALKKTQGELASLLRSPNPWDREDPLYCLREHRHLVSMFFLLATAVKSLASYSGTEGVLAQGGCSDNKKSPTTTTTEYGLKWPELSLAFASPFLINLVVKFLPVQPWSETTAALLFYLAVVASITGLAFHMGLKRYGGWLGSVGWVLNAAGVGILVVPALNWWTAPVASAATVAWVVAGTRIIWKRSWRQAETPTTAQEEWGKATTVVAPHEKPASEHRSWFSDC